MARLRGWGDAECISNGEARVVPWRRLVRRFVAGRAVLEVTIQGSVQNSCGMDQACDPCGPQLLYLRVIRAVLFTSR
jgi:hypothetical protein